MQQALSTGKSVGAGAGFQGRASSQRTAFQPFKASVTAPRRVVAPIRATAAPVTSASASPFAAVDSEAALFGILKAGASSGKVRQM